MFSLLEEKAIEHVDVVKILIGIHNEALKDMEAMQRQKVKVYTVSSCVTRLYAIYENFIESVVSDYLDSLPELVKFSSFSEGLKSEYRIGISYLLSKVGQGRYGHLTHENIVKWYYEALNDIENYRFVTEALTRHEQNFRLNIVDNVFCRLKLIDLKHWLSVHPDVKNLYHDEDSVFEQLDSEIKYFVQLRNDASHGAFDNLEGDENLYRLCDVICAVIKAISSFLNKYLLLTMVEQGKAKRLGVVTESFGKNGAFIAQVDSGVNFTKGEKIYFLDYSNCCSHLVESIMINDVNVLNAVADKDGFEVGIKCKDRIKINSYLYRCI